MKKIANYFLQGLLYVAPLGITIYLLVQVLLFLDGILSSSIELVTGRDLPGLGFLFLVVLLILIGIAGQSIFARPIVYLFKKIIDKTPFLRIVYAIISDFLSAVVGKEKKFNKPVLVTVNHISNLKKLGFLTREDLSKLGETGTVAVYFPHSYNFSGELFIVPKEHIQLLDINPGVAMKFIVSGGVSSLEDVHNKNKNIELGTI